MKKVIFILSVIIMFSCTENKENSEIFKSNDNYKIIDESYQESADLLLLKVRLYKQENKHIMIAYSDIIREEFQENKNVTIQFILEGVEIGEGAWFISYYRENKDLKTIQNDWAIPY